MKPVVNKSGSETKALISTSDQKTVKTVNTIYTYASPVHMWCSQEEHITINYNIDKNSK